MKNLAANLAANLAMVIGFSVAACGSARADAVQIVKAEESSLVDAQLVEGFAAVPSVGALNGSVISLYAGSAFALERYIITVGNTNAPCEGDDCFVQKTFAVSGAFKGAAKKVLSRKIDKNTYSIAILTNVVNGQRSDGQAIIKDAKIVLRVKFTPAGIEDEAKIQTIISK